MASQQRQREAGEGGGDARKTANLKSAENNNDDKTTNRERAKIELYLGGSIAFTMSSSFAVFSCPCAALAWLASLPWGSMPPNRGASNLMSVSGGVTEISCAVLAALYVLEVEANMAGHWEGKRYSGDEQSLSRGELGNAAFSFRLGSELIFAHNRFNDRQNREPKPQARFQARLGFSRNCLASSPTRPLCLLQIQARQARYFRQQAKREGEEAQREKAASARACERRAKRALQWRARSCSVPRDCSLCFRCSADRQRINGRLLSCPASLLL